MSEDSQLPTRIMVVDSDKTIAKQLDAALLRFNINVVGAADLDSALYLFNTSRFEVVFIENEFPPLPGLALIQKWRLHESNERAATAFILLTGNNQAKPDSGLMAELGDIEVMAKPMAIPKVIAALNRGNSNRDQSLKFLDFKEKVGAFISRNKDYTKAAELVSKRASEFGERSMDLLAELYEHADNHEGALKLVSALLEKQPENIRLINKKGSLLLKTGQAEEACIFLEKADKLAPLNLDRLDEMSEAYLEVDKPDESVKKMRELVDLSPEKPDLKFEMCTKLFDKGYDQHAQSLGAEKAKPMEVVKYYNNRGVGLSKGGQADKALKEYDRAVKFFPKYKENYRIFYNMALAECANKNRKSFEKAREYLVLCLELAPDFEKGQKTLATVEKTLGKNKNKVG